MAQRRASVNNCSIMVAPEDKCPRVSAPKPLAEGEWQTIDWSPSTTTKVNGVIQKGIFPLLLTGIWGPSRIDEVRTRAAAAVTLNIKCPCGKLELKTEGGARHSSRATAPCAPCRLRAPRAKRPLGSPCVVTRRATAARCACSPHPPSAVVLW